MKELLVKFIKENKVIQHGDFTLASGQKSDFYLDAKRVTLNSAGLFLASRCLLQELADVKYQAIGGPTSGADPLVAGMIMMSDKKGFMVRKEAKDHGTQKIIDGPVEPGMEVVIVEDTITTGGSAIKAIEAAMKYDLKVKAVCSIFFRGNKNPFDVPYYYLFDPSQLTTA